MNIAAMRRATCGILLILLFLTTLAARAGDLTAWAAENRAPVYSRDTSLPYVRQRVDARQLSSTVYLHLACLSARLKMYPLAMKLFMRSATKRKPKKNPAEADGINSGSAYNWQVTSEEDSLLQIPEKAEMASKTATMPELLETFRDSSNADRYAIILLVKQPVFNKRKVFTGIGNVGHTFISLIRFNRNQSYVSRTFGFYPKKSYPLAASPLFPRVPGIFRDDAAHDWDEMAGRFISKKQFRSIIRAMESYARRRYSLSKNNCTDFGLKLAALGGIRVDGTAGRWPLGYGNNPAWTGQSLLSGDVCSEEAADAEELFVGLHRPENIKRGNVK